MMLYVINDYSSSLIIGAIKLCIRSIAMYVFIGLRYTYNNDKNLLIGHIFSMLVMAILAD